MPLIRLLKIVFLFLPLTFPLSSLATHGILKNYPKKSSISSKLNRYSLKSGIYESHSDGRQISFLLFSPKGNLSQKVPLILFIPGSGEIGFDLSKQFHQRSIFEMLCSENFQKKRPCYLLVLSPPNGTSSLFGGLPNQPSSNQQILVDALLSIASSRKRPSVDMNRLYATGLSFGGNGVYALAFRFPTLFAAIVPVASMIADAEPIPNNLKTSVWHLYNEGDYRNHNINPNRLSSFANQFRKFGNDFRIGSFPDSGHNAWDKAWREESLWNWVFRQSLSKSYTKKIPLFDSHNATSPQSETTSSHSCSSSLPPIDNEHLQKYDADGLDTTSTFLLNQPNQAHGG